MMHKLSTRLLSDCIDAISDHVGLELTLTQMGDLLSDNEDILDGLLEFGPFDTMERETLMDALSNKLGAGDWPMNMDSDEYKTQFYKKFAEGVVRLGYKRIDI